jgi:hypothetical protein
LGAGDSLLRLRAICTAVLTGVLLVTACGPSATPSAPPASSSPSATTITTESMAPSEAVLKPDPACSVEQHPGPADAPPDGGGDLMDFSDFGPGRWRLCLAAPAVLTLEHTAWCEWNGDRTMVIHMMGHPRTVESTELDGYVSFVPPAAGASLTDESRWDRIVSFERVRHPVKIESDRGHVTGRAAFDLAQNVDPELGIVAGAPSAIAGTIAWICGEPPPGS